MREEVVCRKCLTFLGWFCNYCLSCFGNLSLVKKALALDHRKKVRSLRVLRRKRYEVD